MDKAVDLFKLSVRWYKSSAIREHLSKVLRSSRALDMAKQNQAGSVS